MADRARRAEEVTEVGGRKDRCLAVAEDDNLVLTVNGAAQL
jgi:hypothetical protein